MYYLQILTLSVGVIFCSFWHYLSFRDDNVSFRDVLPRTVFYGSSSTFIPSSLSSSVSSSISFIRFRNSHSAQQLCSSSCNVICSQLFSHFLHLLFCFLGGRNVCCKFHRCFLAGMLKIAKVNHVAVRISFYALP
uniref:Uncharacterized protein n=1 Tax=Cacopsylla melanoneura TaxID=428564 RepID=A0A8D8TZR5_9HEMI